MKEYILNIKFGTLQNQLWFINEDNSETEEKWQKSLKNIELLKKSSEDAISFQNNVIEYFRKLGFIRIQK